PFTEHTSLVRRPPPLQQTRWLPPHHQTRARLFLSDGGYPPLNSCVVLLCQRFVKPVVYPASPVQLQTRAYSLANYYPSNTGKMEPTFARGKNMLDHAFQMIKFPAARSSSKYEEAKELMLKGLAILEEIATKEDKYSTNDRDAKNLLHEFMRPIIDDLYALEDGARCIIVTASLRAIWQLLQTAPPEIGTTLRREISSKEQVKNRMESIIRESDTGGWDNETCNHAREIIGATSLDSHCK
ncbi:unnamed protein product, partial [Urochloa humidicola]